MWLIVTIIALSTVLAVRFTAGRWALPRRRDGKTFEDVIREASHRANYRANYRAGQDPTPERSDWNTSRSAY